MNRYIYHSIKFIALGELFGLVFSLFFNYLYGNFIYMPSTNLLQEEFSRRPLNGMLFSVIIWALMGLLFGWGASIFEIQRWSLTKQTLINFSIYYIGFTALAILASWFPLSLPHLLLFSSIFTIIYAVIWLITYFLSRKKAEN
ncbi:DUF3021 domain-containing protein [Lactobacillus kalixensis]|uniref:DUF3021 domain-containing protein n=1 Tax=Lactobacillus kalixensis TaxID=227944 RepID=UPI0007109B23|nr:DUF3021 domain-containing protein [Lactobacillus kalixensis]